MDLQSCRIEDAEAYRQPVSGRTEFLFVRLLGTRDAEGWGEATFNRLNDQVVVALRILAVDLLGMTVGEGREHLARQPGWKHGLAFRIAMSALEQALLDIESRLRGVPFGDMFGPRIHDQVSCYANINRGTVDRSPGGWARRAGHAVASGFSALKMAPFDDVNCRSVDDQVAALHGGTGAVATVRNEVGSNVDLMVDCHWRFELESAVALVDALADQSPAWIEGPVLEDFLSIDDLCQIRQAANSSDIKLAGGEYLEGPRAFAPFLRAGAFDIVNPDIRICGVVGTMDVAAQARVHGLDLAPHNHLGPVMAVASLHLMSVVPAALTLELQFEESDVASCLADPDVLAPKQGRLAVPSGPGLGIEIDTAGLSRVRLQ